MMEREEKRRAERLAFATPGTDGAVRLAEAFRTLKGVRFAHGLERGLQARSEVLAALVRREVALTKIGIDQ